MVRMKSTPRPIRRWFKWGGLVACVILAARELLSIEWTSVSGGSTPSGSYEIAMGHWIGPTFWTLLLVLLAAFTAFEWLVVFISQWRAGGRRHECSRCHYDLSGLPAGTPCPECGRGAG